MEIGVKHNRDRARGKKDKQIKGPFPLSTKSIAVPTVTKTVVFLCDSNGKYIHARKLSPPTKEFSYFRCPRID